ncbi:MAG: WS/DGAT/MGAT family O-acyltransferase [Gemmatimonadota bacterium]
MKALSGLDGAFLHLETPETPMHVASLHLFDLPARHRRDFHAAIRRHVRQRLHQAPVFVRKLAPMPLQFANPVWVTDDRIDLGYHVPRLTIDAPGTQAELEDCIGQLHSEILDRSRPLWRLYVIDGLQSGQVAIYIKVHHAVLDGQAGVLLAKALFDLEPDPPRQPRTDRLATKAREHPGRAALTAAALKHDAGQYVKFMRQLPDVVRTLAGMFKAPSSGPVGKLGQNFSFGPRTPINVSITGQRGFAALSLPLDALKQVAEAHAAKLNDVVLALCSDTLRRYLAGHGGIPKKPLIAAMPISLRAAGNAEYTTQATMSLVNLKTHIADPVRRLRAIRDAAGAVKDLARRAKGVLPTDFPTIAVPWILHGLATLYGRSGIANVMPPIANVVISNVPGPQVPLYAAGARMLTYWPVSIAEHGVGLNITVMSYAGTMGFGFTTARNAVPDARALTHALAESFDELVARTIGATKRRRAAGARRGVAART